MLALSIAVVATEDSTLVFGLDPKDHDQSKIPLLAAAWTTGSLSTTVPMVSTHLLDFRSLRLLLAGQASGIP